MISGKILNAIAFSITFPILKTFLMIGFYEFSESSPDISHSKRRRGNVLINTLNMSAARNNTWTKNSIRGRDSFIDEEAVYLVLVVACS